MTIQLNAGDIVFNPAWTNTYLFKVGTVEAYAAEYNEDPAQRRQKALDRGHDIAWANRQGGVIDNTGHAYARRLEQVSRAIPLEAGEEVEIEGRVYITKLVGKNYSDGIQFKAK